VTAQHGRKPIRVLRVIARLNIGGPAIQAISLTSRLERLGYMTTLLRGREGPREGSMDDLAAELGVQPRLIGALRRDPGPHDALALAQLVSIMRAQRPDVVHTHAAKAGALGRLAALIAFPFPKDRPVLVHTFHGHSLSGYFSRRVDAVYRAIERLLARWTDVLIAVSEEVRDELVALGVAHQDKFVVVPLGFNLDQFAADPQACAQARRAVREELAIPATATLITLIARLVPIKRVDRFLRAALHLADLDHARFLIVGDGELRETLRDSAEARALGAKLRWAGFRRDIPAVCAASDVVVLTSDNEGTPVSLIEAGAAGVPTISTRVGGAAAVVRDGETGLLVRRDDGDELVAHIRRLAHDAGLRARMGEAARTHVQEAFSIDTLVAGIDGLYRSLLENRTRAASK